MLGLSRAADYAMKDACSQCWTLRAGLLAVEDFHQTARQLLIFSCELSTDTLYI